MPHGGKLVVGISNETPREFQQLGQSGPVFGEFVALTVSDTGTGMSDVVQSCIFDPFFTTKDVGKGTGLGLSICYGLVSQNGGHIEVESAPGRGSTFKVYLPTGEIAIDTRAPENDFETDCLPQGSATVLLVEDEPLVRQLVSHTLIRQGYKVIEAANGLEALAKIPEVPNAQIDLVLSDVVMPQMGGLDLAERLHKIFPEIKILLMSGYPQSSAFFEFDLESEIDLIQKPFTPTVLLERVREALNSVKANDSQLVS